MPVLSPMTSEEISPTTQSSIMPVLSPVTSEGIPSEDPLQPLMYVLSPTMPVLSPTMPVLSPIMPVLSPIMPVLSPTMPVLSPTIPEGSTEEATSPSMPELFTPMFSPIMPTMPQGSPEEPTSADLFSDDDGNESDPLDHLISFKSERNFAQSKAKELNYSVNLTSLKENEKIANILDQVKQIFQKVLTHPKLDKEENDKIKLTLLHPDLNTPIIIPPKPNITPEEVMEHVEKTLNSNQDLAVSEQFQVTVGILKIPSGQGKCYMTNLNAIKNKQSIVKISSVDMCAARAILVGYAKLCVKSNEEVKQQKNMSTRLDLLLEKEMCNVRYYKDVCSNNCNCQTTGARTLMQKVGLSCNRPVSLCDLSRFEELLDIGIAVVSLECQNQFVRYPNNKERMIYLYLQNEHYHTITSITGFFSTGYFCKHCATPYSNKDQHKCQYHCTICFRPECVDTQIVTCETCHMPCRNQECYLKHKNDDGICERTKVRCTECHQIYDSSKNHDHKCYTYLCPYCQKYVERGHLCYLRSKLSNERITNYIFYDFETVQNETYTCDLGYLKPPMCEKCVESKKPYCPKCTTCTNCHQTVCGKEIHKANLVVVHTKCNECSLEDKTCQFCGSVSHQLKKEISFPSMDSFGEWLFTKRYANFTCIAHNSKGFDGYFVLEFLASRGIAPKKPIFSGTKIMYMNVAQGLNISFLDSINFLPMALAKLPKAFNLKELKKGYFPYLFNTYANAGYVGPYPDVKYYCVDQMSVENRTKFLEWYETKQNQVFDLDKEILAYAHSDVDILKRACLSYRDLMIENAHVDPFLFKTAASVAMHTFKHNFMKEDYELTLTNHTKVKAVKKNNQFTVDDVVVPSEQILHADFIKSDFAQIPVQGYVNGVAYSKESIQWLEWVSQTTGKNIRHALNGSGEIKIGKYFVDGICDKEIWEFNGCFYHSCEVCFPHDRQKPIHLNMNHDTRFQAHKNKIKYLERCGYTVHVKWEHEFLNELKENPDMKEFCNRLDIQSRLNPRDSFFGGRTNALKLHHKVKEEEEIHYADFTSLYPYVNKYKTYPVGHPDIITENFKPIQEYFGIAKIKILPPRKLYLPVLPVRMNGKLTFPLCNQCNETQSKEPCRCSEEDRAIIGTWCTPEIVKALEKGYEIVKIYEVYHFKETSSQLFEEYVNTFLKFKQEASGWPEDCESESDREMYVKSYFEHEGIRLTNIHPNPGLRVVSKLVLNSFWGKFAQRKQFVQSILFTSNDISQFYTFITDTTLDIVDFHIINENLIYMEYLVKNPYLKEDSFTNIFIATFTTAWARLHLYEQMDPLKERVLYTDTDSMIYLTKTSEPSPLSLGQYLGELTNELDVDEYIEEYIGMGPKNYAFRTSQGREVCHIRGFSLNYTNSKLLNFTTMKQMLFSPTQDSEIYITDHKILRTKLHFKLFNATCLKRYKCVYDKRVIDFKTTLTYPYGY